MTPLDCAAVRALAPELVLELVSEPERSDAFAHLAACAACRTAVDDLARVADRVLLAAPAAQPPPGFESGALARMGDGGVTGRSGRRWGGRGVAAGVAAAVAAAVAAVAVAVAIGQGGDAGLRRAELATAEGRVVGEVVLGGGERSWVLVALPGWSRWDDPGGDTAEYRLEVELAGGRTAEVGPLGLDQGDGAWGTATDLDPDEVERVAVVDDDGREWCAGAL